MKQNKFYINPGKKFLDFLHGDFKNNKIRFIKASILALILGLIIGFVAIGAAGSNPFSFFVWVFRIAFLKEFASITIVYICIYIIGALSLAVGFKANLFNIGVPGQMMGSGCLVLIIGILAPINNQFLMILVCLIVAIVSGALISAIAGALKAYYNIHEVVSTIMIDWIIFYFFKWLFVQSGASGTIFDAGNFVSKASTNSAFTLAINGNQQLIWILPLIFALVIVALLWVIFFKTRFGYKIKLIGESQSVAKYSGVNYKSTVIWLMTLSGAIAGVLGMIYYMAIDAGQINFTIDQYPIFGLNCMSATLIGFNNPIGIAIFSILWGILNSSCLPTSQLPFFHISKDMAALIFGIIIYFAAISIVFLQFEPFVIFKSMQLAYKNNKAKFKKLRKEVYKNMFDSKRFFGNKKERAEIRHNLRYAKNYYHSFLKENYKVYKKNKPVYTFSTFIKNKSEAK